MKPTQDIQDTSKVSEWDKNPSKNVSEIKQDESRDTSLKHLVDKMGNDTSYQRVETPKQEFQQEEPIFNFKLDLPGIYDQTPPTKLYDQSPQKSQYE